MKPVLLLIPGLSGTSALMKWIVPKLEPYFTLLLVDLPKSEAAGDQSYGILCDYIQRHYLPQDHTSPCWVLGESFSGPIAITLSKRHPKRIAGVILAATFATCPNHLARALKAPLFKLLALHIYIRKIGLIFLAGRKIRGLSADKRNTIMAELSSIPIQTLKERLNVVLQCDVTAHLPLTQPVLYLHAKQDWVVHQQALNTLRRLQPQIKVAPIDAPHLILQTHPEESAASIVNFVHAHAQTKCI